MLYRSQSLHKVRSIKAINVVCRFLNQQSQRFNKAEAVYRLTYPVAKWLYSFRVVQNCLCRDYVNLIRDFLASVDLPPSMLGPAVQQGLLLETLARSFFQNQWRTGGAVAEDWLTWEGWEHVTQARADGRGILFTTSHYGFAGLFTGALRRQGIDVYAVREQMQSRMKSEGMAVTEENRMFLSARDLHMARKNLQGGGVAIILPDGQVGSTSIEVPFLSGRLPFKTGFTELAMDTGACVIPVAVSPDERGGFHIRLYPPMHQIEGSREEVQRSLIEQYARHLGDLWRQGPGGIRVRQLLLFTRNAGVAV